MYKLTIEKKVYLSVMVCIACLFGLTLFEEKGKAAGIATPIFKITLKSIYVDGELTEEIIFKETASLDEVIKQYMDWEIVKQTDKELVFQKEINDISPLLKMNGYFGVTEDGVLSIFNGKPTDSEVIHSFFQINVEKLEVKRQNELGKGIRVNDKEQYEAVLEAFKPYMQQ